LTDSMRGFAALRWTADRAWSAPLPHPSLRRRDPREGPRRSAGCRPPVGDRSGSSFVI